MNKLISKIVGIGLGLVLAVGTGVAIGANTDVTKAEAAESTVTWAATSGGLGTGIGTGTISTGSYSWSYERTLDSGSSYTGWGYSCIQLGKNGGVENISFTTSNIPGTIKSVSVDCASYQGKHNISISVGGNSYLASTAVPTWANNSTGTKTGTGTSSGTIAISITGGTRALYIKAISVVYEVSSSVTCTGITANLTNTSKVWKIGETVIASDVTVYAEFSDGTDDTITDGSGVTITDGTLVAGNNTVTVTYGGQTDTIDVFAKAPTAVTVVTSSGTSTVNLNANNNAYVTDTIAYEVSYNTTPSSTDYAATFSCSTSGWSKTADDGQGNATLKFESNGSFEITIAANDDSTVKQVVTYVVSGIPSQEYELFTSSIVAGDYVFMSSDYTYVMSNTISSNRVTNGTTTPTVSNDKITNPSKDFVWHIAADGNYWTIQNSNNSKYLAGKTAKNTAELVDEVDDHARWTITYENDEWVFENLGRASDSDTPASRYLRNNTTYGWAAYASSTGNAPALFKLPSNIPAIELSVTGNTTLGVGETATITANKLNGASGTVGWATSNSSVLSISADTGDSIIVTAVAKGNATITASLTGCTNATQAFVVQNGTASAPYTVAEARAAIDANEGITSVYTRGVIYQIDEINTSYGNATYWISDDGTSNNPLEIYRGKNLNNTAFTSQTDINVGDTVIVYGTLKKFSSTYEYDSGNYITSHTPGQIALISITGIEGTLEAVEGATAWELGGLIPKGVLSTSGGNSVDISSYVELTTTDVPGAVGQTTVTVTVTPTSGSVSASSFPVSAEVISASGIVANGQHRICATRDGVTYYLKENGTSAAPSAVTNFYEATVFTFTLVGSNKYTIKNGSNYLYCTATNNGVRFGNTSTAGSDRWTITAGEGTLEGSYNFYSAAGSRYLSLYEADGTVQDWRGYTSATAGNREENTDLQAFTATQFATEFLSTYTAGCIQSGSYDANNMMWDVAAAQFALLSSGDQSTLASASANQGGSTIEQAVARYDFIVGKYGTSTFANFMNRSIGGNSAHNMRFANINNNSLVIVLVVAFVTTTFVGGYFFLRKKKEQ